MATSFPVPHPAVELAGVHFTRGQRTILDDLDFVVQDGEWVNIIGPNGAGKTTLLHVIAGIVQPEKADTARVYGVGIASSRKKVSRIVSLCPQRPQMPEGLNVRRYVELGRLPHQGMLGRPSSRDAAAVAEALDAMDVKRFADRELSQLSGGEMHRVVLARALAQEPQLLLLDEPTAALDIGRAQEVLEAIDALRARTGITIVTAIHDLTLAGRFGDTIAALFRGRIGARGAAEDVFTREFIDDVYGARVTVLPDQAGPVVVPRRA